MKKRIYLDYMATTPVDERVAKAMLFYMTFDGIFENPASRGHGEKAALAVENAREQVAQIINAEPAEIIWTSGATESNNLAIKGACRFYHRKGKHIITLATEHKSVLESFEQLEREGFEVTWLFPESNGLLSLETLKKAIRPDTIFVSIMHVNNEIGVIQDIAAIGQLLKDKGIIFHVDAAQSLGKIDSSAQSIDVKKMHISLLSMSAHKMYGPKGIGALYVSHHPRIRLMPLIHGGKQEQGLRAGTLPTHQIVGMGEACKIAQEVQQEESERILKLRNKLWNALKSSQKNLSGLSGESSIHLNGDEYQRVPGNLNISFDHYDEEKLADLLKDFAYSTTSACASEKLEASHVLKAIGLPMQLAKNTVRLAIGRYTTEDDIDRLIAAFK